MRYFTCFCFVLFFFALQGQNERKVLIIGIDGVRGDAALAAQTPNLDALAANGIISYDAQTLPITYSGPGWSTILTGVWMDKHKVTSNAFIPNDLDDYPHFFQHVKNLDASISTASIVHWSPVNTFIAQSSFTDLEEEYGSDEDVKNAAINHLTNNDADVTFLHFDDVDGEGHSSGFSASNPDYLAEIEVADGLVGEVVASLQNRPNIDNEDWLIIICTDHGGEGTGHDCYTPNCQDIFLIVSSDLLDAELIEKAIMDIPVSSAVDFSGGNDARIEVPNNAAFNFNDSDFTVEVRLKTDGWSGDPAIISDKDWNSGFNDGFVLACNTDGSTWKFNIGGGLVFRMDMDGGPISDGEWHHIAVSLDRNGRSFTWQDGYIREYNIAGFATDSDTDFPLVIGQDGSGNYGDSFNGMISEVRIWRTNLRNVTLNEWNCKPLTSEHPNYSDLVGWWTFDEGTGTQVTDVSPTGAVGDFASGAAWSSSAMPDYSCLDYSGVPDNSDIVPTAMDFLCLEMNPAWGIDGRSWAEGSCIAPTLFCEDISLLGDLELDMFAGSDAVHLVLECSSEVLGAYPQVTIEWDSNPYISMTGSPSVPSFLTPNGTTDFYPEIDFLEDPSMIPQGTTVTGTATLLIDEFGLTCTFPVSLLLPSTVSVSGIEGNGIYVYPTVTRSDIMIERNGFDKGIQFQVIDGAGRVSKEGDLAGTENIISIPNVPAGSYFLILKNEKGEILVSGKILKL